MRCRITRARCYSSRTTAFSRRAVQRVLELTPEGVHQYGGGYTEYVARTGHEAPGLHS
jgi:hypothetical protein